MWSSLPQDVAKEVRSFLYCHDWINVVCSAKCFGTYDREELNTKKHWCGFADTKEYLNRRHNMSYWKGPLCGNTLICFPPKTGKSTLMYDLISTFKGDITYHCAHCDEVPYFIHDCQNIGTKRYGETKESFMNWYKNTEFKTHTYVCMDDMDPYYFKNDEEFATILHNSKSNNVTLIFTVSNYGDLGRTRKLFPHKFFYNLYLYQRDMECVCFEGVWISWDEFQSVCRDTTYKNVSLVISDIQLDWYKVMDLPRKSVKRKRINGEIE